MKKFFIILCFTLWVSSFAHASIDISGQLISEDRPAAISAEFLDYDAETEIVTAEGSVEIYQDKRLLMADKIIYDQQNNIVKAYGNIALVEPDGNVYFSDQAELRDDLKQGVVNNFRARLADNSLFASNLALREDEFVTRLESAVYSPCKLCKEDPSRAPQWQIKAKEVKIDQQEEKIHYRNSFFEIYGAPILYTPYFSHPTPNAKHKSGFLVPTYSHISTLGTTVKLPYYYNLGSNMDATFVPFITSEEGPVMSGEVRHLTNKGFYQFSGSITQPDKRDELGRVTSGTETRGHIEGYGNFALKNDWNWGFDGKRSSDDTYLRRYKFGNEDRLTSTIYAEKMYNQNYIAVRGVSFQSLTVDRDPALTPFALPLSVMHFETSPSSNGSRFEVDGNALALHRDEGSKIRRLSFTGGWKLPYVSKSTGSLFELSSTIRGDAYHVEDVSTSSDNAGNKDGAVGRAIPEVKLGWSLPFVSQQGKNNIFIEPVADLIVSPYGGNPSKIPNQDSQELELSDVNIFSSNHVSGLDRIEAGPRANYGFRGGVFGAHRGNLDFLFAQSYRTKTDANFQNLGGYEDNFSDYVGRIGFMDGKVFDTAYRFRLDKKELTPKRNEFSLGLNLSPLRLDANYVTLDRGIINRSDNREEVFGSSSLSLNKNWMLYGNARRDLSKDGGLISSGGGLIYQNECITVISGINREFTRDRDIEPSSSYSVQISFKNIN